MNSVELYHKLRNFLVVKYDRQVSSYSTQSTSTSSCGHRYIVEPWAGGGGVTLFVLRWGPKVKELPPHASILEWSRRPTYEEFCTWYGLELEP